MATSKINDLLRQCKNYRSKIADIDKQIAPLEVKKAKLVVKIAELEKKLLGAMNVQKVKTWKSAVGSADITPVDVYACPDWEKLGAYIIKTKALDLLQKRLSKSAVVGRPELVKKGLVKKTTLSKLTIK